jgi:hypothetical protein
MFAYTLLALILSLVARADAYIATGTLDISSNSWNHFETGSSVRGYDFFINGAGRDSFKGMPAYDF